jgi:hypothetical protein
MSRNLAVLSLFVSFCLCGGKVMGETTLDRYSEKDFLWHCKEYGCEETLRREKRDGLIRIDFRNTPPPDSVTYEDWSYSRDEERKRTSFFWHANGEKIFGTIDAYVYDDYESARLSFMDGLGTSRYPPPWVACDKKIGTICAAHKINLDMSDTTPLPAGFSPTLRIFFAYKNVYINISGSAEPMAEWLFEVLKQHPRTPMPESGALSGGRISLLPFTVTTMETSEPK